MQVGSRKYFKSQEAQTKLKLKCLGSRECTSHSGRNVQNVFDLSVECHRNCPVAGQDETNWNLKGHDLRKVYKINFFIFEMVAIIPIPKQFIIWQILSYNKFTDIILFLNNNVIDLAILILYLRGHFLTQNAPYVYFALKLCSSWKVVGL